MRSILRRVSKLEAIRPPAGPPRVVVRYEGKDCEDPDDPKEPEGEIDENTVVITVRYVDKASLAAAGEAR
jgi:hypothetical protein